MGDIAEMILVETRSDDAPGQLERGKRDKHADGNFSGFRGIEVFKKIVHGSSPWLRC